MAEQSAARAQTIAAGRIGEIMRLVVVPAMPLAIVLAVAAFMVEREGGFALTVWSPLALVVLAIAATVAFSAARVLYTGPRTVALAAASLVGFAGWDFVTILTSPDKSAAWDGSNRNLFYVLVFAFLAGWSVEARVVWPVVLAGGLVVAGEGVLTVVHAIHASDPTQFLIESRLSEPLGYPNATAALFMIVAWLMVGLASRAWIPPAARGLAFGLAGLCGMLNLLSESRGSVFTLPAVVIAYLVLVPGRLRSLATLAVVALGMLPAAPAVLHVYNGDAADVAGNLRRALELALVWSLILAVAGWALAVGDGRLKVSAQTTRIAQRAVGAVVVLVAVAGLVVLSPWQRLDSGWHSFKYGSEPTGKATHFGGLGSNRYDFWRVGLIEFKHHPLQGIGPNNFLVPYLQQRRSSEEPIYPHSLAISLLSQTGIVGTALFTAFLALAGWAIARIPRGRERELAGVLAAGACVWLLHGLVDWLWEMPVLSVLGFALLGTACGLAPRRRLRKQVLSKRSLRIGLAVGAAGVTAAAVVSLVPPWLAAREVQRATRVWPTDPSGAASILSRAHDLDPLSDQADVLAGAMAGHLHRYDVMRDRYQDAVNRSPNDWYANLELGIAASLTGRHALAGSALEESVRLNPGEPISRHVLATFRAGRPIDSDAVDREFADQAD